MAFSGWIASLSNGETVFETPAVPGEPSSWQKLLSRIREDGLKMTALRLQRGGTTIMARSRAEGYVQCGEIKIALISGKTSNVQGIGTVIGDQVIITWMDNNRNIWQDVRPLNELRIHSTLA